MGYKRFIAFDYGSSNVKVNIASYNGKEIKLEKMCSYENYPISTRGIIQWDILKLYSDLLDGIEMSVKRYNEIESIGISSWGGDFALLDKDDYLIGNPSFLIFYETISVVKYLFPC